ncbi:hypothetical protein BG46_17170 [Brucella anthropi]|uniref:hypothetical protein n=1 Tax=Brucella anthropi TaxID=529 RepID=UPI00044D4274|nr:hypothetical protein [Brucella anthropi]EXL06483.1 hypothetical protein BG46_17170 [Brucella anthropi]
MATNTLAKPQQRFQMGHLVITRAVANLIQQGRLDPAHYIARHLKADWGDLSDHDWATNDRALRSGEDRLFSSYEIDPSLRIYIITEWDRSATTLMLPSDY